MSKITSPRNFKIGGDEPDYDKFEPFCTVIDNREIMLNRRIKATYCQLDTKIAINQQGLKYDLDTFHKTIRIKPIQKEAPKNLVYSPRKKANSVLRSNKNSNLSQSNGYLSPLVLSPNQSNMNNRINDAMNSQTHLDGDLTG